MVGGGAGRRKAKGKGKAKEVAEVGASVVILSNSGSTENNGARNNDESGKMKMVADGLVAELDDQLATPAIDKALSKLLQVFPDVCRRTAREDLASQLKKTSPGTALRRIVDRYIEHGRPKVEIVPEPDVPEIRTGSNASGAGTSNQGQEEEVVIAMEVIPSEIRAQYNLWSLYTLSNAFPRFPLKDLKRVYKANKNRFPPSYKAICFTYSALLAAEKNGEVRQRGNGLCHPALNLSLRGGSRNAFERPKELCPLFERESLPIMKAGLVLEATNGGAKEKEETVLVESRTDMDAQAEAEGPSDIECGCCYSDYRFEEMVQCAEGHLFCFTCLRRRVQESIFGAAKASTSLPCMDTTGCEGIFPWSEVRRALPPDLFAKYEQRQAEHAVAQAKIAGLVFCPFCSTPWQVDPDMSVLECANEKCLKASCIKCREPSHIPLQCVELEKQSETASRRSIEERMTKAIVRECSGCHTELLKNGGCNKVTCPCGQVMCYLCREVITKTTYQHFCQCDRGDNRNGVSPCKDCSKCRLYEQENEDKVASAAREAAIQELAQHDPSLRKRTIGPALETLSKKQKAPVIPARPFRPPPPEYYNLMAQAMVGVAEQAQHW